MKTIDEIREEVNSKRAEILARGHVVLEEVRARPAFPIPQAHDPEGRVWELHSRREEQAERLADVLPGLDHAEHYWVRTPEDLSHHLRRARTKLTQAIRILEANSSTGDAELTELRRVEASCRTVREILDAAHAKHMAPINAKD